MASYGDYKDLGVTLDDHVAVVEIQRPPHNFFDFQLIASLASAFEDLGRDDACRAIMLCAQGKAFCAGANFGGGGEQELDRNSGHLYQEAVRLFRTPKPVVGAIQGAAIGGGLGLALMPDFRVASPEARFSANFTRLGFHPGFGLTVTLPEVIGKSQAALMFYTSRRIKGEEAHEMGLVDVLVPQDKLRETAHALAAEIAENSPLGVVETRATLRGDLADRVKRATDHELAIQDRLRQTEDFQEGIRAVSERRVPNFKGR
ncbi:MAG: enoyl-CoA hydratase [Rhizobiales bacterium NRL2]|jgi:enoyl-CoA hydratase/carnithine racemase|nr:MAG: enoyl-CoA hydratase [Rhizobiales bacterium NRL2]